ncbi:hypothetical protein MBGDN05_00875, partial [Thermoplasmatales archaeon SCGC AB-539-N05]
MQNDIKKFIIELKSKNIILK